jgi:DNA polymerase
MERGSDTTTQAHAASVLQWWADAGVDVVVGEEPRDWLRPLPNAAALADAPAAASAASAPAVLPLETTEELPGQLDMFQAYLRSSEALSYASPSAPRVCPSGNPASGLMILTDMPTSDDCSANTLLSGEAGRLFDRMLAAIGRDRNSVYLAALSCLRSPDGRFTTGSAQSCATLARHHIGLAEPRALLLLGDAVSKALLGLPMPQARGRWHEVAVYGGTVRALVTIPPTYLLNQPAAKRQVWDDLQLLMEEVNR